MFRSILLLSLLIVTNSPASASVIDSAIARQSPDEVIAHAFGDTKRDQGMLKAPGAVFRAHGNWYRLKYRCATSSDGLDVTKFIFVIGEQVDRSEWTSHILYPDDPKLRGDASVRAR